MKPKLTKILGHSALVIAIGLLGLNLYGLTQSLRPQSISLENLRFGDIDVSLSLEEFQRSAEILQDEPPLDYAKRLTGVIASGLAHVHWEKYEPERFNQLVPLWENYILWLMGKLRVTPEYYRYHFSDPKKTIERGIGICGDASMLMSQLLDRNNIQNKIITIPGHVMVEVDAGGSKKVLDPDFGVILDYPAEFLSERPDQIGTSYSRIGHGTYDDRFIQNGFRKGVTYWDGVSHFITKKYYFEKVAYILKWLLPTLLLVLGVFKLKLRNK